MFSYSEQILQAAKLTIEADVVSIFPINVSQIQSNVPPKCYFNVTLVHMIKINIMPHILIHPFYNQKPLSLNTQNNEENKQGWDILHAQYANKICQPIWGRQCAVYVTVITSSGFSKPLHILILLRPSVSPLACLL